MTFAVTTWSVFLAALATAVATGFGALPLLAVRRMPRLWLGIGNAIAAGLMIAASFSLIYEGIALSSGRTVLGIVLGVALIVLGARLVHNHDSLSIAQLKGADAKRALLIVGVMTVHSAAEGIGVGVSFGGGEALGLFITTAIAVHNIPEGLAIALVMVPRGASVLSAAWWSVFSSLPQPLLALPAFWFVLWFQPLLPVGLGLAAGAMIWMAFAELLPDALEDASPERTGLAITLAVAALIAFQEAVLRVH